MPDELLSVLTATYFLPPFTNASGQMVVGLDDYHALQQRDGAIGRQLERWPVPAVGGALRSMANRRQSHGQCQHRATPGWQRVGH